MNLQDEINQKTFKLCKLILQKKVEDWTHEESVTMRHFLIAVFKQIEVRKNGTTT